MPDLLTGIALVALVISLAALVSGIVERALISFPMIFLAIGILLGEPGLGLLHVSAHDPTLEAIAIVSLGFVLYLDALSLRFDELGRGWAVPILALGPGTLLTVLFVALAAGLLFGLPPVQCLLLGSILASVDPVLLRDVVRDERIPRSIRLALQTEAGTNDMVVLPLILILSAVALGQTGGAADWLALLGQQFVLGPLAGVVVGAVFTELIKVARARTNISRVYRALYGVGTILAAYVAGEAVGGSGFLAVFAAGATVAALDYDLCDCFLEYGETTAELAMLLAFTLFGAMLSAQLGSIALLPALALAVFELAVARPVAIALVLRRAQVSRGAKAFIGWFGPRGLSTLLFGLLLILDGVPGAESLFAVAGVVVVVSVVLHGVSAAPLAARYAREVSQETLPEEREGSTAGLFEENPGSEVPRITADELAAQLAGPNPPIVLDVRSHSAALHDNAKIPGSIRVEPDRVVEWGAGQPRDRGVVAYCT